MSLEDIANRVYALADEGTLTGFGDIKNWRHSEIYLSGGWECPGGYWLSVRWSGLRKKLESNFAPSLDGRVSIHSTRYGNCSCGRAWITLDKTTIANFCTRAYFVCEYFDQHTPPSEDEMTRRDNNYKSQLVNYGEMSRQSVYEAAWAFVHDMPFDEALKSDCPFTQSLAMLDKRLGKRRLQKMPEVVTLPLPGKLLTVRLEAERVGVSGRISVRN